MFRYRLEKARFCQISWCKCSKECNQWPIIYNFFKWTFRPLYLYFCLFNTFGSKQMFNVNFADGWIQTEYIWCRRQPLGQLTHNHLSSSATFCWNFTWDALCNGPLHFRRYGLKKGLTVKTQCFLMQYLPVYAADSCISPEMECYLPLLVETPLST